MYKLLKIPPVFSKKISAGFSIGLLQLLKQILYNIMKIYQTYFFIYWLIYCQTIVDEILEGNPVKKILTDISKIPRIISEATIV